MYILISFIGSCVIYLEAVVISITFSRDLFF